jgi:DNA-binding HxlR family transcriptional regulator
MLTFTLRGLERDGLITRTVAPTNPPRVTYELSELGRQLVPALHALATWAYQHRETVKRARTDYDRRDGSRAAGPKE